MESLWYIAKSLLWLHTMGTFKTPCRLVLRFTPRCNGKVMMSCLKHSPSYCRIANRNCWTLKSWKSATVPRLDMIGLCVGAGLNEKGGIHLLCYEQSAKAIKNHGWYRQPLCELWSYDGSRVQRACHCAWAEKGNAIAFACPCETSPILIDFSAQFCRPRRTAMYHRVAFDAPFEANRFCFNCDSEIPALQYDPLALPVCRMQKDGTGWKRWVSSRYSRSTQHISENHCAQ